MGIETTTSGLDLPLLCRLSRGRTEKVGDDRWLPDSFTRANAQWVIHGFISTLIYTSELILCFTIWNLYSLAKLLLAKVIHLLVCIDQLVSQTPTCMERSTFDAYL